MASTTNLTAEKMEQSFRRSCLEGYQKQYKSEYEDWALINQSQMKQWFEDFFKNHICASGGWIRVEDGLPERPEKKIYQNVQCGHFTPKGKFIQHIGFYAEKHKVPYEDYDGDDKEYDPVEEANGTLYLKEGWYELVETPGGAYDEEFQERKVTHWQPLPPPPVEQKLNQ